MLIILVILTLAHVLINGFHDGCNVIATIISSRSMSPQRALIIACLSEFAGVLILGTAVAQTMGTGIYSGNILHLSAETVQTVLLAAVAACIVWNIITYLLRMPSSSSHALVGGLVGSGIVVSGFDAIIWKSIVFNILIPLFITPLIGFVFSWFTMKWLILLFRNYPPKIASFFKKIQFGSLIFMGMSHGSNDAQKGIGIIALAFAAASMSTTFQVKFWMIAACALAISIGLSFGGWQIIKTFHKQVPGMTPLHSLASQAASGIIIYVASIVGFPVSTTQTVGSSIMGAGAGYRLSNVRWGMAKNIILAWLLTIPAAAIISAITCVLIMKRRVLCGY